jgi:hypothetical protein
LKSRTPCPLSQVLQRVARRRRTFDQSCPHGRGRANPSTTLTHAQDRGIACFHEAHRPRVSVLLVTNE